MNIAYPHFLRLFYFAMAVVFAVFTPDLHAIAPAAPTNLKVSLSPKVYHNGNLISYDRYLLTWNDNAIDESGYRLNIRFGNVGPFSTLGFAAPDQEGFLWMPTTFFAVPGQIMQFQVVAFKYNAALVETRASPIVEISYPSPAAGQTTASGLISTPSGLAAQNIGDGRIRLTWSNASSTGETYHQVFYKTSSDTAFTNYFYVEQDVHEVILQSGQLPPTKSPHLSVGDTQTRSTRGTPNVATHFAPGSTYQFKVRSVVRLYQDSGNYHNGTDTRIVPYDSDFSSTVAVTMPALAAPTSLQGSVVDQTRIRLRWVDNSYNESGYKIEYKGTSSSTWFSLGSLTPANASEFVVTTGSAVTLDWRVSAVYNDPVSGNQVATSSTSNEYPLGTGFPGPSNLTATDTGYAGKILLEWKDNSEAETNYELFARVKGTDSWKYITTLAANARRAQVSQATFTGSTQSDFPIDTELEFLVEAVIYTFNEDGEVENRTAAQASATAIASATARDGFTSRSYEPISQGVFFSHQLSTSNEEERVSWSVEDLPTGLSFDAATGIISGTPTVSGYFPSELLATFNSGHTAVATLNLRVLPAQSTPQIATPIQNLTIAPGLQFILPLSDKFADTDSQAAARLRTTTGDIDILLYPDLAPESVTNFLHYVNNRSYNNVIFHRSVPDFIIQGGSYQAYQAPSFFVRLKPSRPSPVNEPGISNLRGTVAWAKLPGTPDSATLDFFFNLGDNSENLDEQNEGFAAFGRVAGNGMTVVDNIASKPIGAYRNFNPQGGTDTSLDKRVYLVDFTESGSPFISSRESLDSVPINTDESNAPVNMDVNEAFRILQATEIQPVSYSITANTAPSIVTAFVSGTRLALQGLQPGASTVTVQAADLDGNLASQSFTVNVVRNYRPAAITRHPVTTVVLPGATARLTVTATGTGPLQYQWMKDGQDITGQTGPRLEVTAVDETKTGEYAVRVWNESLTVRSNIARIDLRTPPVFTAHPTPKIVEVGSPLELEVNGTGAPVPTFVWLRSGRAVPRQTTAKLSIPSAKLTDGGIYIARASNIAARNINSNSAEVLVVDKGPRLAFAPNGRRVALQAQASGGPGLQYNWLKNGQLLLVETDNIKGIFGPVLTINSLGITDLGEYTCSVSNAEASLIAETGPWKVSFAQKPVLQNFTADTAYIGLDYDFTPAFGGLNNNSVVTFGIRGLPRGLKFDAATCRITGKPTLPGVFTLTVTGRNPAGTSAAVTGILIVQPMPEPAVGTFVGQVGDSQIINDNKGGRIDFTVTDNGMVSGKLTLGKDVYSFKGEMQQSADSNLTSGQVLITRRGKSTLGFVFSTVAEKGFANSGDFEGILTDGVNSVAVAGFRKVYHTSWNPYGIPQSYNIALELDEEDQDDAAAPKGTGYMRVTTNTSGVANCTGRLADGTTITSSSPLGGVVSFGQSIRYVVYQNLYKNTGTISGQQSILILPLAPTTQDGLWLRVTGQLSWMKDAQVNARERNYKEGFGPLVLNALGMTYSPPVSTPSQPSTDYPIIFRLPRGSTDNASITFDDGGLDLAETNPNVPTLTINNANTAVLPTAGGINNPGGVKLSITPSTGLLTGSFTLNDTPELKPKRSATFHGLVIPRIPDAQVSTRNNFGEIVPVDIPGAAAVGVGHFLLAQKPSEGPPATTLTTSPILSGSFRLTPSPINITQQPVADTVDPGENYTFTVAANTPGGTLSYQWRKNGVSLSGKTGSSLTLSSITETDEGTYDVIIFTEYSRIVSAGALLTVNDPVSSVIISRSPANSVVDENTRVTFTAVADGSGTLSYQWRKDGGDIEGATESTYVIESASSSDVGQYSVRVSSAITPAGLVSNVIELDVATGVTNPLLARVPAGEKVAIGTSVTFTAYPDGRPPHHYTWMKNGVFIEDADDSPTFVIPFVSMGDIGMYSVLVSNDLTPDGVLTNEVELDVDTRITTVIATREPSEDVVPESTRVEMTASNTGLGPFEYQWYKDGQEIDGATSINYVLEAALEDDSADYTVRVFNESTPEGVLSNPLMLAVAKPVSNVTAAMTLPTEGLINTGDTVELTGSAQGTGPLFFQWFKDGIEIDGAIGVKLTLSDVTTEDNGSYTLRVSNAVSDGDFSNSISVQVQSAP